jgi:prevent-host-death family protein
MVMATVSMRDLHDHGGDVVDRATSGEHIVITRSGRPVAELRAVEQTPAERAAPVERAEERLPPADAVALLADIDRLLDAGI